MSDRVRLAPWFLIAIIAFGAISAAREAWRSGDFTEAIGPLLVLAIFALSWWRGRARERR
jgi:hypothetical protein